MKNIRIVWCCNKKPTKVSSMIGQNADCLGGWLDYTCGALASRDGVQLSVLFPDSLEYEKNVDNFGYYSFIEGNSRRRILEILGRIKPDIIHVWGTEFPHSNETLKACEELGLINNCVVSIQGLVSLYGKRHYIEGLPEKIVRRYTLRDFIKKDNVQKGREMFLRRGEGEIEALQRTKHVIGRTDWDRAAMQMFNSQASYHFCNESLRDSFYQNKWDISKIKRHSIFVSQCSYPIKGFHYMLEAMPEIIKRHPDAHIYTTGRDLLHPSRKEKILMTSYQKYLLDLIKQYHLSEHVSFLGMLSEAQMCKQYLKANVFVSASTIENSPNSVGEAMLVGCPVVASDVGGVKNMLEHGREGFVYQSSAPYMLAYYVNRIFEDDGLACDISEKARKHAAITHDREINMERLCKIYEDVMESAENIAGGVFRNKHFRIFGTASIGRISVVQEERSSRFLCKDLTSLKMCV